MATAAPSAGAPSAQPATGEGTPQAPASPETTQPQESKARTLRPIKSLPGVVEADQSDELLARITGEPLHAEGRDEKGRFLRKTAEDSSEVPLAPDAAPKPDKFKWAGEEWDSEEKAVQSFKSMRGQFKANATRAAERDDAAASARGWHAESQRLQAELDGLRGGKGDAASAPAVEQPAQADGESIDWALYAEVKKAATEAGQPDLAEQWLAKEQERSLTSRLEAVLKTALKPIEEASQNAYLENHTNALFESLADYAMPDGTPAFPELANPESAFAVGQLWHNMGLPSEIALTPQGAVAAIQLYRGVHGSPKASADAAPGPAPSQAPALDARAVLEEGVMPSDEARVMPTQRTPEAERIVAALRKSGANIHIPHLGFGR